MFGGGGYSDSREVCELYEKIGRKHVNESGSSAGLGLVAIIVDLKKEVSALRSQVASLEIAVRDLRKPKRK